VLQQTILKNALDLVLAKAHGYDKYSIAIKKKQWETIDKVTMNFAGKQPEDGMKIFAKALAPKFKPQVGTNRICKNVP
jgi:hypothetical protein